MVASVCELSYIILYILLFYHGMMRMSADGLTQGFQWTESIRNAHTLFSLYLAILPYYNLNIHAHLIEYEHNTEMQFL